MAMPVPHACDLSAERERLRFVPPHYGKVRRRERQTKKLGRRVYYCIDFYPALKGSDRFLNGIAGSSFKDQAEAERIEQLISIDADRPGMTLADAVARYRHPRARQNLVVTLTDRWIEEARPRLAPATLRSYLGLSERYFGFWAFKSIHEVSTGSVREWVANLQERGLAETTIQHTVGVLKLTIRRYVARTSRLPSGIAAAAPR